MTSDRQQSAAALRPLPDSQLEATGRPWAAAFRTSDDVTRSPEKFRARCLLVIPDRRG